MKNTAFAAARIGLGCVFAVSGFIKLTQPHGDFLAVIKSFEVVGGALAGGLAYSLPWVEFLAGVFLALGLWLGPALCTLWVLNTAFIGALVSAVLRRLPVENCGCFGEALSFSLRQMIFFDILIWFTCLVLFRLPRRAATFSLDDYFR